MTTATKLPSVISIETLSDLRERSVPLRLIDVRTPAEYETVHIPGSYNVPLDQIGEHRVELVDALDSPAILICRTGGRARQAEQELKKSGLSQLHVLEGGISAWESAEKPVVRSNQERWSLERQIRGVAGAITFAGALGGLLLWRPLGAVAAAVGAGLLFSAITNTCGMAMVLAKLPYNRTAECDVRQVIGQLSDE
ncbi:MAG: rhodanese-like domain-containing protein [Chloroflexota bacterium]